MRLKLQVHLPQWITKWFPLAIWRMPDETKTVYLTFDDGPIPEVTPWVLDLLKKQDIKATFFAVGENVFRHPEVFDQILEEGHAVGNHTYHHLQGLKSENKAYFEDIEQANKLIGSNLFRPPHGWLKRAQYRHLTRRYKIIMWDVISCDYNRNIPKEEVLENVIKYTRPGSIITFHDSKKAEQHLYWALPRAIRYLKEQGYEFKKIEIPKVRQFPLSPGIQRLRKMRYNIRQLTRWA
jgi:peptidoglycan/xylan/chitin deacetylase (PgdA/CDA1 family)